MACPVTRARIRPASIALATVLCVVTIGSAQAQTVAAVGAPPAADVRALSAHADRVVLMPTAETHPAGTLFFDGYEIVVAGAGYALTDDVQASITFASDFSSTVFVDLSCKGNLLRSRYLRLAAAASLDYAHGEQDELPFGRATGIAQLCADPGCRSSLSLGFTLVAHDAPDTIVPLGLGAGFIAHVGGDFDMLLEYSAVLNAGRELDLIDLPVYLLAYGARMSGNRHWALDVTLLRPLRADSTLRSRAPRVFDLLGVPFLAFTYRVDA